MSEPEGIVVLGCARSGTTLVRRLLDAHPEVCCPPETGLFTAASRFLEEQTFPTGVRFGAVPGLWQLGFDEEVVLGRLREMCFDFLREHAAGSGKPRWAEKTVSDVFHLEGIERLLGEQTRYVCVVRHGLDVVVSLLEFVSRAGSWPDEIYQFVKGDPSPALGVARAWVHATNAMHDLAERRPGQVHLLRYEDVVADPAAAFVGLCEFVGVAAIDPSLDATSQVGFGDWKTWASTQIHAQSTNRFTDALSRGELAMLAPVVNPTLERAGYAAVKAKKVPVGTAAQKRLELGMRLAASERASED